MKNVPLWGFNLGMWELRCERKECPCITSEKPFGCFPEQGYLPRVRFLPRTICTVEKKRRIKRLCEMLQEEPMTDWALQKAFWRAAQCQAWSRVELQVKAQMWLEEIGRRKVPEAFFVHLNNVHYRVTCFPINKSINQSIFRQSRAHSWLHIAQSRLQIHFLSRLSGKDGYNLWD